MNDAINQMLLASIATICFVIAAFFLRFWRRGRDPFFALFAASFAVEGLNRATQALSANPHEGTLARYGVRLVSFALILAAIAYKNRAPRGGQ